MMMSAPAPDWIAEVMRDCRSLALTVSTLSVIPSAFLHSCVIGPLSSVSEAGTKSAQRSQWTPVSWAIAGARPLARMAAMPPDADSVRTLRRAIRAMIPSCHVFHLRVGVRWNYASLPRTCARRDVVGQLCVSKLHYRLKGKNALCRQRWPEHTPVHGRITGRARALPSRLAERRKDRA